MNTPLTPSRVLRVQRGESLTLRMPAGTQLVLREGRLLLEGPSAWLGERLHLPQHTLQAGDAHRLDTCGWMRLSAKSAQAELLLLEPSQANAWRRLLGLLRLGARRLDHLRPLA